MDREETAKILTILRASYPKFYDGMSKRELENIVNLWQEMFDEPYPVVAAAVKALVCSDTKGFPPVIGQVKDKIRMLTHQRDMTPVEAWSHISKALKNSTYGANEEFKKLPEVIQGVIGGPDILREWAQLPPETVQSVIASKFESSYQGRLQTVKEWQALPEPVKEMHRQLMAVAVKPMPELPPKTEQGQIEQKNDAIRRFKTATEVRDFLEAELGKAFASATPAQGREMTPEEAAEFERRRKEAIERMRGAQ